MDNIDHVIISNSYENYPTLLLDLYYCLLRLNYFLRIRSFLELVYFLKPDKPPDETGCYRPISLLQILGKIFEKMILKSIYHSLRTSSDIQISEHGIVEGKTTVSALQELFSQTELNIQEDFYIFLISLAFQNAFDRLPWIAIIQELQHLDLELPYINIVRYFLSLRGAFPNWLSDEVHCFHTGCPQGSYFGPFLCSNFKEETS